MIDPKSLTNLRPFRKGENSKTRGRPPKGQRISELAQHLLDTPCPRRRGMTYREAIARAMLDLAVEGDVPIIRELLDRTEGRVVQQVVSQTDVTIQYKATDLSDDELAAVIARGGNGVTAPTVGPISRN